jgi:hypothetical protein
VIIELAQRYLNERPDGENVAHSIFRFPGVVTAKQLREAITGRPNDDYVNLHQRGDGEIEIDIRRKDQLGKFFVAG